MKGPTPSRRTTKRVSRYRHLPWLGLLAILGACSPAGSPADKEGRRSFTLISVNDIYRIEGLDEGREGGLARLRSLRREIEQEHPDLLLLHAGDLLFPSMLSRLYRGEQMIDAMNLLDGSDGVFDSRLFVTFGNHEFDDGDLEDAKGLQSRIEQSDFDWLATNIVFVADESGQPLVAAENLKPSVLVESGGVRIGIFSLTTDMAQPEYVAEFESPTEVARRTVAKLRSQGAEVVLALTHLQLSQDEALLRELGDEGPDLILGGHEHNRLTREIEGRWVLKADADGRTAIVATVTPARAGSSLPPHVDFEFRTLSDDDPPPDPLVEERVASWLARHDREYCREELDRPAGCLQEVIGRTRTDLTAEELEIRRFETNLGNWIVDRALLDFSELGAQLAFTNSGGLRSNSDISAGTDITRLHVEEIFAYPTRLVLLRIDGSTLQRVVSHAITDWTGNGHFLQIAGFAYRHDPSASTATDLTLLTPDAARPIAADEELLVVTNDFLVNPRIGDQDGFDFLTPDMIVDTGDEPVDLRDLVIEGLRASLPHGIAPEVVGRICNSQRSGPCLALP